MLAFGALAAMPLAWFLAGKLHRFAYWIGRKTDAQVAALARDGWSVERLEVEPGVKLVGLVRAPRRPDAPWILFAPGNSSAQLDGFQHELDQLLQGQDHGVAFFAYRGFDASDGTPTPAALGADLERQWRWLRERGVAAERIEIWGYSLGTVLAANLAVAVRKHNETPRRVVLLAAAEHIPVMRAGCCGRFLPDDVFAIDERFRDIPTVLVHGAEDDALPIAGARALQARCGTSATLHELPGRGHVDLWADARRILFTAR